MTTKVFELFGTNGITELKSYNDLPIGTTIQHIGYGDKKSVIYENTGHYYKTVDRENLTISTSDYRIKPIAEKRDRRIASYFLDRDLIQPEVIMDYVKKAEAKKKRMEEGAKIQAKEADEARERLIKGYPFLKPCSEGGKVSKNIKLLLIKLFPGVKFSVKYSSFSMGDSVSVNWTNGPKIEEVNKIVDRFNSGSFNGMEDIYEYEDNIWHVFGSTKYIHTGREFSEDLVEKLMPEVQKTFNKCKANPYKHQKVGISSYEVVFFDAYDGRIYGPEVDQKICIYTADSLARNLLSHTVSQAPAFELTDSPEIPTDPTPTGKKKFDFSEDFDIKKNVDTRDNSTIYVAKLKNKVDRESFNDIRKALKPLGGYYSRFKGGFIFKENPVSDKKVAAPQIKMPANNSEKLKGLAEKMQPAIDAKFADRLENTHRRAAMGESARSEGRRLKKIQKTMINIAEGQEKEKDFVLGAICNKAQVEMLLNIANSSRYKWARVQKTWPRDFDSIPINQEHIVCAEMPGDEVDIKRLKSLGIAHDIQLRPYLMKFIEFMPGAHVETKEEKIKKVETSLIGRKFDGYFPTPQDVVSRMIDESDLSAEMEILEPSAGKGDIVDGIKAVFPDVKIECSEIQPELRKILELKGHDVIEFDCMDLIGSSRKWDRIIMNPPFEKGLDARHIIAMYDNLKPGGKLISLSGESIFFRSDSVAFRDWLDNVGGRSEKLPAGSFKSSDRPTGVNTRLIVIDK